MKTKLKKLARPNRLKEVMVKDIDFAAGEAAAFTRSAGPKKPVKKPNRPVTRPR